MIGDIAANRRVCGLRSLMPRIVYHLLRDIVNRSANWRYFVQRIGEIVFGKHLGTLRHAGQFDGVVPRLERR